MKTLYLIRHAKSSWENVFEADFKRPLNERGHTTAPKMAQLLRGLGVVPDQIVSSPANRALTTAQYFAKEFGIEAQNIVQNENIYEASVPTVLDIVQNLPNDKSIVLLFGHNPTFTSFANRFNAGYIDNLPTCGIVKIELEADNWSDFNEKNAHVRGFWYPKGEL